MLKAVIYFGLLALWAIPMFVVLAGFIWLLVLDCMDRKPSQNGGPR